MRSNVPKSKQFGEIFGDAERPSYFTREGTPVWMWRKRQRVRFLTADGEQIGTEQRNIAPAVCAAMAAGWIDYASARFMFQEGQGR